MNRLVSLIAGVSLALFAVVVANGSALAAGEDEIVTITGEVVVAEQDEAGDIVVTIVTETDTYLVHQESKASDIKSHHGKKISAKGKVEVSELSRTISVDEYALIEEDTPPVGSQ